MSSEFDNSHLVSVFCTTNGMYFVDMLLEIIFVYPCLFCDSRYYVNLSSSFVSSFLGFWRPVTIMHDLQEYESASSSRHKRRVFTFHTTASSPSIIETVPSKQPTLSISSSIIFCCFLIISLDLLVWWFSCCWDVGWSWRCWWCSINAGSTSFFRCIYIYIYFLLFFVSYASFHNKNFITNYVNICEISLYMILSFVFATNHLVKTWPHAAIMEWQKKEKKSNVAMQNPITFISTACF